MKLAYVLDSWPRLSETFVRRELSTARKEHDVRIVALARTDERVEDDDDWKALDPLVTIVEESRTGAAAAALRNPLRFARAAKVARAARVEGTQRRFLPLVAVARELRRFGVERIHAHFARWSTAAAEVLSAWTGAPFGFTAHAYDLFDDPVRFAEKAAAASWVVTCSEYGGVDARRLAGPAAWKVVTIRHGLDLDVWSPSGGGRAPGPLRVLGVGRLLPIKGFDVLIDAVSRLRQRDVRTRTRLLGGGDQAAALAESVRTKALDDVVALEGPRPSAAVRDAMRAWADVVVVPSRRDRLPNTIAEAFACGRPVVSTTVGGIRELVTDGETGLLVPPGDPAALADALARLDADPALRERLGAAARRRIEEIFDGPRNVAALLDVIGRAGAPVA